MMTTRLSQIVITSLLLGTALSCFALAITLIALVNRFASDLDEVLWTWNYVHSFILVGLLALALVGISQRKVQS